MLTLKSLTFLVRHLFSGRTILPTIFSLLPVMTNSPSACLCFLRSAYLLFRRQTLQSQVSTASICEGVQNRKEGSSGWKVRFISKVWDSCCCLTFAAHLPSILPLSPNPSKLFFSLITFFSLSYRFFCLYRLTPAIFWEEIDKNETFFQRKNAEHARIK